MVAPDEAALTDTSSADHARLLSFLAHELRTPVTVAVGTLAMLESARFERLPPAQHHLVELAMHAVARLQAMADDMSLVARVARGEWPLHMAAVSVDDIIADVAHTLHGGNPAVGVDIPAYAARTESGFGEAGSGVGGLQSGVGEAGADTDMGQAAGPGATTTPFAVVVDRTSFARAIVALAWYVVREATADAVALRGVTTAQHHWLVVSAPGPVEAPVPTEKPELDPATNGSGFALHASAAILRLHGLRAVRLAATADGAAVGVAFPR